MDFKYSRLCFDLSLLLAAYLESIKLRTCFTTETTLSIISSAVDLLRSLGGLKNTENFSADRTTVFSLDNQDDSLDINSLQTIQGCVTAS